jgi:hypothetical protein
MESTVILDTVRIYNQSEPDALRNFFLDSFGSK